MVSNEEGIPSDELLMDRSSDPLDAGGESGRRLGRDLAFRALSERWWLIAVVATMTIGTAVVLTTLQAPRYEASASLIVTPDPSITDTTDLIRCLEALERRTIVATLARIPATRESHGAAARAMGWSLDGLGPYNIRASVVTNTNVIKLDVQGPHAENVAKIANSLATVTAIEGHDAYPVFTLRHLTKAIPADNAFLPQPGRNYTLAAVIGLFLGLTGAVAVQYLREIQERREVAPLSSPVAKQAHSAV